MSSILSLLLRLLLQSDPTDSELPGREEELTVSPVDIFLRRSWWKRFCLMNCFASYVITYLCCYKGCSEAASDKSDRFPVWSYFRLQQTEDKKTLCSKKKKQNQTSGEKPMCSGQLWKRLIAMDCDTQLQYVPTSVMWRDKIILPLSKIQF